MALTVVSSSQMFGHEDILSGRKRTTGVKCISKDGIIHCISAQEFIARFIKDERTWTALKKIAENNDNILLERMRLKSKIRKIDTRQSQILPKI